MAAELRDHICECESRRCRDRIYITVSEYRELSKLGRVVSPGHERPRDEVVKRAFNYRVVRGGLT